MQTSVDSTFSERMGDIQKSVADAAESMRTGKGLAPFMIDGERGINTLQEDSELDELFDRSGLDAEYMRVVQNANAGSHRDVQAIKLQMDVLSGLERDLRMRYRGRVRMTAHAAARLASHGLGSGPVQKGIVQMAKLLMEDSE